MRKKILRKKYQTQNDHPLSQQQKKIFTKLQQMIKPQEPLETKTFCQCQICKHCKPPSTLRSKEYFKAQNKSDFHLYFLLENLTRGEVLRWNTRIKIPIFSFFKDGVFRVFYNNSNYTLGQPTQFGSLQEVFSFMKKREQDERKIHQSFFQRSSFEDMKEDFIHKNYFEKIFPSFFLESTNSQILYKNRRNMKNYIIHDNDKYIIQEIERHKLKKTEPFCIMRFQNETCQVKTLQQAQIYTRKQMRKKYDTISYIESFTLVKKSTQSIFQSEYQKGTSQKSELFKLAVGEILTEKGEINCYHPYFFSQEKRQKLNEELEKNIEENIQYLTYKIVILFQSFCDIKIIRIKIKWVLSKLNIPILQNVPECQIDDFHKNQRIIRQKNYSPQFKKTLTQTRYKILRNKLLLKQQFQNSNYQSENSLPSEKLPAISKRYSTQKLKGKTEKSEKVSKEKISLTEQLIKSKNSFTMKKNPYKKKNIFLLKPFKTEASQKG